MSHTNDTKKSLQGRNPEKEPTNVTNEIETEEGAGKEKREAKIRIENEQKRGDIALELRGEQSEARLIKDIKLDATPESQGKSIQLLDYSLSYEVIPQLLDAGASPEQIAAASTNPEALKQLVIRLRTENPDKFYKWDSTTDASFGKLLEVFSHPDTPFARIWKLEWSSLLDQSTKKYREAKLMSENHPSTWDSVKEIGSDTLGWVNKHRWTSACILGGVLAGGWLAKKLFFSKDPQPAAPNPDQKAETPAAAVASSVTGAISTWGRRLLLGGVGAGAIWLLAKFLPTDKIKEWARSLVEDTWLGKAMDSAAPGKAAEIKEEKKERNEFHEKAATAIGLEDPSLLEAFGEYDYESFMSLVGQAKGAAATKAKQTFADSIWGSMADSEHANLLPGPILKFIEKKRKEPEKIAAAEGKLRAFLEKHESTIKKDVYPRTYVKEVLDGLGREGVFGESYKKMPMKVDADKVPTNLQQTIRQKYATVGEQNAAMKIAYKSFEKDRTETENIFGARGLVVRMEQLAQKDPSYTEKIEDIKKLHEDLSGKRTLLKEAIERGDDAMALGKIAEDIKTAEDQLLETAAYTHAEMAPHSSWPPLLFFVAQYAAMPSRRRAAIREQVRKIITLPGSVRTEYKAGKDPVTFYEKELVAAREEQELFERTKPDLTPQTATERAQKAAKVDALEKRVVFEKKVVEFKGLTEAERNARASELFKAEQDYLRAHQKSLGSNIEYAKEVLKDAGANVSNREKIQFIHDIKTENGSLGRALEEHRGRVLKEVDRLGPTHPDAQALVEELDRMTEAYRHNVKTELSIIQSMKGEASGLRKEFVEWLKEEKKTGAVKIVRNRMGGIGVMGLLMAPGLYFQYKEIKESNPAVQAGELMKELGLEAGQMLADVMPLTFGASDWYTLSTGEELITGRKVKGWDKYSHAIWGTMGALLDAATVVPAVDLVGAPANGIMRLARASGKAAEGRKIIKLWPRIKGVAEKLGGWKKFGEYMAEYRKGASRMDKVRAVGGMVKVAAPRLGFASYYLGGKAYKAIYTMGDDAKEAGIDLDPNLVHEIEAEPQEEAAAPEAPANDVSPEASQNTGS